MKTNSKICLSLLLVPIFIACNRTTPAGFWNTYHSDLLEITLNDQGSYGGHRAMYWESDRPNTFTNLEILTFADENGWTVVDSAIFPNEKVKTWTFYNKPVFPLTSTGFSDTMPNDQIVEKFPRWFGGPLKLYKFRTGWVTTQPGTDNSMDVNGFAMINDAGTKLAVYHLWGE
jgi:hypothetical protein